MRNKLIIHINNKDPRTKPKIKKKQTRLYRTFIKNVEIVKIRRRHSSYFRNRNNKTDSKRTYTFTYSSLKQTFN